MKKVASCQASHNTQILVSMHVQQNTHVHTRPSHKHREREEEINIKNIIAATEQIGGPFGARNRPAARARPGPLHDGQRQPQLVQGVPLHPQVVELHHTVADGQAEVLRVEVLQVLPAHPAQGGPGLCAAPPGPSPHQGGGMGESDQSPPMASRDSYSAPRLECGARK